MDLFRKLINVFFREKEKIKENINNANSELQMLSNNLEQLSSIEKLIDSDINAIDTGKLKKILSSLNINLISDDDLNTLDDLKKIIQYLYDPKLPNIGIKRAKLLFISEFKNKIKNVIKEVNSNIDKLNGLLSTYHNMNEKVDKYLSIVGVENFYINMSADSLNEFFDFLEMTSVDRNLILEVVFEITLEKAKHVEKLNKDNLLEELPEFEKIEEEIEKNVENLIGSDNKSQETKETDLSLLNEEERKLLEQLEKLFSDNNILKDESLFGIFKEEFKGFTIDERIKDYFNGEKLDLDMIAVDYFANLLPNINTHKEEVLSIVKYIIDVNEKLNKSLSVEKEELQKQIKFFGEKSNEARDMVNNFYATQGEYYSNMSDIEIQDLNNLISDINILLTDTIDKIEKNIISSSDLLIINQQLNEFIDRLRKNLTLKDMENIEKNSNGYNLETTKTLILLLKDKDGNYVPVKEMENEIHSDVMMNELQKSIVMISEKGMYDNKKRLKTSHVVKTTGTGNEMLLKDYFRFDVDRLRFSEEGRTGFIIVPVHENNRGKLTSIYGDNIFNQNYNSIILIVSSIFCSAGRSEYNVYKDLIEDNISYVNYIINLFKNPNANIDEMRNIIEESAKECKKISSRYGRGGK